MSLDLLFLQTIEDLDLGWLTADPETKEMLSKLASKKQKKEVGELYNNSLLFYSGSIILLSPLYPRPMY